jgi:YD repeat-containing protein
MESRQSGAVRAYIRSFGRARRWLSGCEPTFRTLWLLCAALLCVGAAQAQSIQYVHDANGRLVAVTASNGTSVQYGYDTLGHPSQISAPLSPGQLAIFAFAPTHGAIGTPVTIQGQGFDTNAANDTVSFNGAVASVASATTTQLMVSVPSGATTGPLSVMADGQTAASATPFVIDDTGEPPAITQVSPTVAAVGSTVTVTGTHLDPLAGQTTMLFGDLDVSAGTTFSDSQIQHIVSASDTSGLVTVITPYGQAVSTTPVIVPPSGLSASNIVSTAYGAVGGSVNLNIGAGGQTGAMLFVGNAADWISLQLSAITTTASTINYAVYAPGNQLIAQGTVSSSAPSIHLPQLLKGGTYLAIFTPSNAGAQLTVGAERAAMLASGTPVTLAIATQGETKRLLFQGTIGQSAAVAISNTSTTPTGQTVSYTIYNPGQTSIATGSTSSGTTANLSPLPNTGTYQVIIGPGSGVVGSTQLEVVTGAIGTMTTGGPAQNYTAEVAGQNIYLGFNGIAGANMDLTLSNLSVTGGSSFNVNVYGPNGNNNQSFTCNVSSVNCRTALWNMVAGSYTVVLSPPSSSALISATPQITQEITGPTLTPNTPVAVNLNVDQVERFTFNANAGDTYALQLSGVSGQPMSVNLYSPTTSTITVGNYYTTFSTGSATTINLLNLPATGTYTLVVYPGTGGPSSSAQLTLVSGVVGSMTIGGAGQNYTSDVSGQNVYVNFTAAAGANLDLTLSSLSVTGGNSFNVYVYGPTGTIQSFTCYVSSVNCRTGLWNLGGGSYTVAVSPPNVNALVSFTPQVTQEITGPTLTPNAPIAVNLNVNQVERYTFNANAGDTYALQLSGVTGQSLSVNVYSPTTSPITTGNYYTTFSTTGSTIVNLNNLPATGTYTLVVYPGTGGPSSSGQLTLVSGVVGTMTPGGAGQNYTSDVGGQNIYVNFTGAAGANLDLTLSNLSVTGGSSFNVNVYGPNGSNNQSFTCNVSSVNCRTALWNLVGGSYTVMLSPPNSSALISATPQITQEIAGSTLTPNTPIAVNLSVDQVERYTFNANAGDTYALQLSGVTGQSLSVNVYSPTTSPITVGNYYTTLSTSGSTIVNLSNLPATGAYTLVVYPGTGGPSSSGQLTLVPGVVGTMTTGGTGQNYTSDVGGQNIYLNFTGTAGANLDLTLSNLSVTGGGSFNVNVYGPNSNNNQSFTCNVSSINCRTALWNMVTGSYTVVLSPPNSSALIGATPQITQEITGPTLEPNLPVAVNLSVDQVERYTFNANAGDSYALQLSSVTGQSMSVNVYSPTTSPITPYNAYTSFGTTSSQTINLSNLPATGTYTLVVYPGTGGPSSSAQLTLLSQ